MSSNTYVRPTYGECITDGCEKEARFKKTRICNACYMRQRYNADPEKSRERARTERAAWRAADPEKAFRIKKNAELKKAYGITLVEYEAQLEKQGGMCALCDATECSSGRMFAVDHCHETGNVRGLLCGNCNHGLGKFKDNVEVMARAIDYLNSGGVW